MQNHKIEGETQSSRARVKHEENMKYENYENTFLDNKLPPLSADMNVKFMEIFRRFLTLAVPSYDTDILKFKKFIIHEEFHFYVVKLGNLFNEFFLHDLLNFARNFNEIMIISDPGCEKFMKILSLQFRQLFEIW